MVGNPGLDTCWHGLSHQAQPWPISRVPPASLTPSFPLQFTMTFEKDEFKVKLPDGHQLTFPNRLGHNHLSYLSVQGGFNISSFKLD